MKCAICLIEGKGFYTKVTDSQDERWIHYICGLLCDDYTVEDWLVMDFVFLESAIE